MMKRVFVALVLWLTAFPAFGQWQVPQFNIPIGRGPGVTGFTPLAPSATAGLPLVSQGTGVIPAYGVAGVAGGGTGLATLTNHGVLIGQATSAIHAVTMTNGQLLVGQNGADPVATTIGGNFTLAANGTATAQNLVGASFNTQIPGSVLVNYCGSAGGPAGCPGGGVATPVFAQFGPPLNFGGGALDPTIAALLVKSGATGEIKYDTVTNLVNSVAAFSGGFCTTPGTQNVGCGSGALVSITSGSQNSALGVNALFSQTTGTAVGIGFSAGYYSTTSIENVFVGGLAGYSVKGFYRDFISAWNSGTTYAAGAEAKGSDLIVYKSIAGGNLNHNPVGGGGAFWTTGGGCNTTDTTGCRGSENTVTGHQAMYGYTSGSYAQFTTANGLTACQWLTYGNEITCLGVDAGLSLVGAPNAAVLDVLAIGPNALGGDFNPDLSNGGSCHNAWSASTTYALNDIVSYSDTVNANVGHQTVRLEWKSLAGGNINHIPNSTPASWTANLNSSSAQISCGAVVSGSDNVAIGPDSMLWATTAYSNTFVGRSAGFGVETTRVTGTTNVGIGHSALHDLDQATGNVAVGYGASLVMIGPVNYTVAIGFLAGQNLKTVSSVPPSYTILIGYQSGTGITAGANNIRLGHESTTPTGITSGTGNVIIGNNLGSLAAGQTNTIVLGDGAGNRRLLIDNTGNVTLSVYGSGTLYSTSAGSLSVVTGTTTTVLHGNAAGAPSFSAVSLTADVSGTLPVTNGGLGIASGTSGGVLYFSGATTLASSGALTANAIILGGGAGAAPTSLSCSTATTVLHGGTPPTCTQVSLTADVTGTLPVANGGTGVANPTVDYILVGNGSSALRVLTPAGLTAPFNIGFAISAASSALTIALKDAAGSDPSSTSPVLIPRNSTGTSGTQAYLAVTAATSLVISSGSTMGVTSSTGFRLWIVGFDDSGTFRLGVINCAGICTLANYNNVSSTAEGGAGAADSAGVFYTGTAVSSKPYVILGFIEWNSTGLTAGTWTTTNHILTRVYRPGLPLPGQVVQTTTASTATRGTSSTSTSYTATGVTLSGSITPSSAANGIIVEATGGVVVGQGGANAGNVTYLRVIRGTSGNTQVGANVVLDSSLTANGQDGAPAHIRGLDFPNTTSSQTYSPQIKTGNALTDITFPYGDTADGNAVGYMIMQEIMGEAPRIPANDNDGRLRMVG